MTEVQVWGQLTPTHHEALMEYAAFGLTTFPHTSVVDDLVHRGLVTAIPAGTVCGCPMARLALTGNGERLVAWAEATHKHPMTWMD